MGASNHRPTTPHTQHIHQQRFFLLSLSSFLLFCWCSLPIFIYFCCGFLKALCPSIHIQTSSQAVFLSCTKTFLSLHRQGVQRRPPKSLPKELLPCGRGWLKIKIHVCAGTHAYTQALFVIGCFFARGSLLSICTHTNSFTIITFTT